MQIPNRAWRCKWVYFLMAVRWRRGCSKPRFLLAMQRYAGHDDGTPGNDSVLSDCVNALPIRTESIWLDYGQVSKQSGLLQNLSAIAWDAPFLWTASDEGRSVECLEPHHGGYRLRRQ